MIDFRYDPLYELSGIRYNGKHSYLDFGITLRPLSKFKEPQVKDVTESVPFMDGEYLFTYLFGKPAYSRREFTLDFNIYGNNRKDLYQQKVDIVNWLYSEHGGELIFDDFPEQKYTDVYARVNDFEFVGNERAVLSVDFSANPYLTIGNYYKELLKVSASGSDEEYAFINVRDIFGNAELSNVSVNADYVFSKQILTTGVCQYSLTDLPKNSYMLIVIERDPSYDMLLKADDTTLTNFYALGSSSGFVKYFYRYKHSELNAERIHTTGFPDKSIKYVRGYNIISSEIDLTKPLLITSNKSIISQKMPQKGINIMRPASNGSLSQEYQKEVL